MSAVPIVTDFEEAMNRSGERKRKLWHAVATMESEFCDVKIGIKENSDSEDRIWIGANRSRLKEQSSFFRAVWKDPITGIDDTSEELKLDGISAEAMRAIVAVSYDQFQSVEITEESLVDCVYAAHKYDVPLLFEFCDELIQYWSNFHPSRIEFGNFLVVIIDLDRLGMTDYAKTVFDRAEIFHCSDRLRNALFNEAALDLPFEMFSEMVQSDILDAEEYQIWERCIEWCRTQVRLNQEDITLETAKGAESVANELLRFKPMIRFQLMNGEQLAQLSQWESVIPPKELAALFVARFMPNDSVDEAKSDSKSTMEMRRSVSYLQSPLSMDELFQLKKGDLIEHCDEVGNYLKAEVIKKEGTKLTIHYIGWDKKWDCKFDYTDENDECFPLGSYSLRMSLVLRRKNKNEMLSMTIKNE